jgi:aminoglycoside phosphotransferase family enzyme/predicted kinase
MEDDALAQQQILVAALQDQLRAAALPVALYETHISWVLVAGADAYKIKKAVKLPFLDFSTLEKRRHYCLQEASLNARLAPGLYLGVVDITGSIAQPCLARTLAGTGPPVEVAVHMRAFAQAALWSERIARGQLGGDEIDRFAKLLARFHADATVAAAGSKWGSPQAVAAAAERNVHELIALAAMADKNGGAARGTVRERGAGSPPGELDALGCGAAGLRNSIAPELARLSDWQAAEATRLRGRFTARKQGGAVRACHGDLHCGNILTLDDAVMAFDCIEFDDALRWIDTLHDLAFTLMDLRQRGETALAARLLNVYLEQRGDHDGLTVLRFYEVDCALVRAKIALLRARQATAGSSAASSTDEAVRLVGLAGQLAHPPPPALLLMHGCSGSGKSHLARRLVELFGAVQLRSDVERSRIPGVDPHRYDQATNELVYARLRALAGDNLDAGFPVVVDACHLKRSERAACVQVAQARGVPWLVVDVQASVQVMRERIARRRAAGADPSEADESVLAMQLAGDEPLVAAELAHTVAVDTGAPFDAARVTQAAARLWPGRA